MSIATYITSIEANRNTIRNKLVELGLAQSIDNFYYTCNNTYRKKT